MLFFMMNLGSNYCKSKGVGKVKVVQYKASAGRVKVIRKRKQ
jgi:hypothetical protein